MNLIVDDLQIRHDGIKNSLPTHRFIHAYDVTEAILQIKECWFREDREPVKLGMIFLDHDIESGRDQRDVMEFVKWLVDDPEVNRMAKHFDPLFFIHSHNPSGAENMFHLLKQHGFRVAVAPFGS